MIAQTPPMGWNSWDCYGAAVTEETVRANAEYMASFLKPYGWEYVVVDIQWSRANAKDHAYEPFADLTMDEFGRLTPALNRFPSAKDGAGFRPLADYVHSLGLKFGIHIMRGLPRLAAHHHLPIADSNGFCHLAADPHSICAWNPDVYGLKCDTADAKAYYDSIFRLYASWGVDFVKCDDIAREYPHCQREIELISEACRNCGREMVLSLSPGPAWMHHFSARSNIPFSSAQSSQKSSVIRHMLALAFRCSACSSGAGPGDRLSTMSRPQCRQASEINSISRLQWGYSRAMSSHLTKSTPHWAYRRKMLS